MNRSDVVAAIVGRTGVPRASVEEVLEAMFQVMAEAARAGESIRLPPYLKLEVCETPAATRRNPRTGAAVVVPAGRRIKVGLGKGLRDAVL